MNNEQTFAILLSRLPKVDDAPGLILLMVDASRGTKTPRRIGTLTDAAVRGRLAHFDVHSANEVAAIRQELKKDRGQATVYESWPSLNTCLQFWYGFVGSQIRPIEWLCESCGIPNRENVGGSVGESFLYVCKCGQTARITIAKQIPPL
ncbi:MAG: hypothetical protein ACRD1P_07025 [Thermoanaerobaculia bacterium]